MGLGDRFLRNQDCFTELCMQDQQPRRAARLSSLSREREGLAEIAITGLWSNGSIPQQKVAEEQRKHPSRKAASPLFASREKINK